ncbi:tetratricopeptide repeat protein, partial [Geomonas sp.]|uniref:tetratricopeptide repeat protein n=1 Tax=Geomonas sp. TaxID=2651584 RepID=UPI002B461141
CLSALQLEPDNPAHFINLARIHLVAKQKADALRVLRQGMAAAASPEILALLEGLGNRKPPVLSFLHRDHFLNKYLGILLSRLRLR